MPEPGGNILLLSAYRDPTGLGMLDANEQALIAEAAWRSQLRTVFQNLGEQIEQRPPDEPPSEPIRGMVHDEP